MSARRILDGWINPVTPPAAEAWARLAAPRHAAEQVFGRLGEIGEGVPMAETVAEMREAGITHGMVVALTEVSPWEDALRFHEHVAEEIEPFTGQLQLGGGVDMSDAARGVAQLEQSVAEYGLKALYIVPSMVGRAPDDELYVPYYEACDGLGIPVVVVVGIPGGPVPAHYQRPLALDSVCLQYPDLTVVGAHIGYPWEYEMIAFARRHPNLYIMTCGWAPARYPPEIVAYLKRSARHKLVFGTDYPLLPFDRCTTEVQALQVGDEHMDLFVHDNGAKVFGFATTEESESGEADG